MSFSVLLLLAAMFGQEKATVLPPQSQPMVKPSSAVTTWLPGTGIIIAANTISVDTAVVTTQATAQAGTPWRCMDTSLTGPHSCTLNPKSTALSDTQPLYFVPGFNAPGGPDTIIIAAITSAPGAKPLVMRDGVSDPTVNAYRKGVPILLIYSATLRGTGAFVIQ